MISGPVLVTLTTDQQIEENDSEHQVIQWIRRVEQMVWPLLCIRSLFQVFNTSAIVVILDVTSWPLDTLQTPAPITWHWLSDYMQMVTMATLKDIWCSDWTGGQCLCVCCAHKYVISVFLEAMWGQNCEYYWSDRTDHHMRAELSWTMIFTRNMNQHWAYLSWTMTLLSSRAAVQTKRCSCKALTVCSVKRCYINKADLTWMTPCQCLRFCWQTDGWSLLGMKAT